MTGSLGLGGIVGRGSGPVTVVLGSGPVALAHALFAARWTPVVLAARAEAPVAPGVESVPAPLLTLLLELGIHPIELDVAELHRRRRVAWEGAAVLDREARASAHLDRAALLAALWRRVRACPALTVESGEAGDGGPGSPAARRVDATGRGSTGAARRRLRPPRAWLATTATVPRGPADPSLHLAAGPDGYAYRLGSARWLTLGWVGPGRGPHTAADLQAAIETAGAGWLLDGVALAGPLASRLASLAVPEPAPSEPTGAEVIRLGDAALARDALASQGLSLGLSDARLAARPDWTPAAATARTADATQRHVRSLAGVLATCRHRHHPAWRTYAGWLASLPETRTDAGDPIRRSPNGARLSAFSTEQGAN